tara:strand:- start:4473 stop:5048 length:576 start_codon:yes stop_codon:yes gene_type:complete
MEIAKDTYKIKGYANIYLILKPIPTLIDSGNSKQRKRIIKEIEKIIPIENIKRVILTHLHYDHSGNLDLFKNAEIYVSKEELEDYKKNPEFFSHIPFSKEVQDTLLNKAKNLPKNFLGIEVIKVPGHTKGSVCFMDKKRKLIYTGDTLFCIGIGRTDLPNSEPKKIKYSLEKIIKLIDKYDLELCPSHDEY